MNRTWWYPQENSNNAAGFLPLFGLRFKNSKFSVSSRIWKFLLIHSKANKNQAKQQKNPQTTREPP